MFNKISLYFKIRNFLLLFFSCTRYLFKGKANKIRGPFKNILVVQKAKLGDMVCVTPMFRAIKNKYPKSKLYVVGNGINKKLLEGNHDIDEYIILNEDVRSIVRVIKKLLKSSIDFGCTPGPNFMGQAIMYLSGIPMIAGPTIENGFSPQETRPYKIIKKIIITRPHKMGHYAPKEYLKLLEPIGIFTDDTKKHLAFSKKAEKKIEDLLFKNDINHRSGFVVGISPSAGNKIKMWGRDRFAALSDFLFGTYKAKIIIIGGKDDIQESKEMIGFLSEGTRFLDTTGMLDLDELKALISKLSVFISVDTGPIYIAEAFGVPTIDITGPIDEKEQPPIGRLHKIVKIENRSKPELYVMNAKMYDKREARRQIDEITLGMVIDKFKELYEDITS